MLSKQLKDSQRHQRQPKQVELFLQSYLQFIEVDNLTNKVKQSSADFSLFTIVLFNIKDKFSAIG